MSRKVKIIKFDFLSKNEIIDYQTMIEERVGNEISKLACYDDNYDNKTEINGTEIERDRAYFVADCDYEVIIRPKK